VTEKSMSLYQLSAELKPLEDALEAAGGDTGAMTPEVVDRVTELLTATQEKADAYGRYAKHLEAMMEALDIEIDRLIDRRQAFANRLKRLKQAADQAMAMRGITKIEGVMTTINRQRNGGKPGMALKADISQLPEKYKVTREFINMEKLRADAEAGDAEALLYAEIKEVGYSVHIR
jgi:hypothetical protein